MQNARPQLAGTSAHRQGHCTSAKKFPGTDNPRHLRALNALMKSPTRREIIDKVAGCSNGPELVAQLRRLGLDIPCQRILALDCDGKPCRPGVYYLTLKDRRLINQWLRKREGC